MTFKRILPLLLVVILAGGAFAYWKLTSAPPPLASSPVANDPGKKPDPQPAAESEESKQRRRLLGVWQDEYKGKRTMTLNDDGTGTMLVELSGLQAFLVAPKLRFDMKWSLDGKTMTKKTIGGEPADKVNLILNTMGNTATDTLLELTDDRLHLLDKDGTTKYDWKRVPAVK